MLQLPNAEGATKHPPAPTALFGPFLTAMYLPPDWRGDLNYSCRTGAGLNLDALPTAEGV